MALVSVIKYNGDPDTFAWKYPNEELGAWTQLIVAESQQAILFKGGQALDVFEAGRHTLDTANIPILSNLVNLPFGGRSPFTAEVWFVNKIFNLDVKWGTPSPIQIQDAKFGIFVPIRSSGTFGIQIDDPKKFLVKLVGTLPSFKKQDILNYFRGLYITRVKDAISTYLVQEKISALEINAYLDELSDFMKERIAPTMAEYGVSLPTFFVNDISMPEDDPAVARLKETLAKRAEMNIIGYSYEQERSFDTLESAARNEGGSAAPVMGAGLGLGMGLGMGTGMGSSFSAMASHLTTEAASSIQCQKCGAVSPPTQNFCSQCGESLASRQVDGSPSGRSCVECGAAIGESAKFCPECGKPQEIDCAACGTKLKQGSKFCPECGKRVGE